MLFKIKMTFNGLKENKLLYPILSYMWTYKMVDTTK